ncbi:hypothetical protein HPB52_019276 [Rhipicephalus sanguineus]|uniref:Tick transposon n=1 Tax=Rhipicephalus sanguineus TaxID=34632 RepID=A0A9D4PFC3_RHISA|nr:hypothetical protein HPB52_019276 [Rhipicephalus sanguineus]
MPPQSVASLTALLRLRTGCVWIAAHLYDKERSPSPSCERCDDTGTLEHLLCACRASEPERSRLTATYRQQGLAATTNSHLLFPSPPNLRALYSFFEFVEVTGITA